MSKSRIDPNAIPASPTFLPQASAARSARGSKNIITGTRRRRHRRRRGTEDIQTSDVTLVTLLVDASSSIHRNLTDAVRPVNMLVDALATSPA